MTAEQRRVVGTACPAQPLPGSFGVRQRIDGGKGFRLQDEQRGRGIEIVEDRGELAAVHGRGEMQVQAGRLGGARIAQCTGSHVWPEIRAADTDIDDGVDGPARITRPLSGVDALDECFHARQGGLNFRDDIDTVQLQARTRRQAQCAVQRGAVFRGIDGFTGKQALDPAFEFAFAREAEQQIDGAAIDALLGKIEQQAFVTPTEFSESVRLGEQLGKMPLADGPGMGLQIAPGLQLGPRHGFSTSDYAGTRPTRVRSRDAPVPSGRWLRDNRACCRNRRCVRTCCWPALSSRRSAH